MTTKDIRSCLGGSQRKVYLRPIQEQLDVTATTGNGLHSLIKHKCHVCQEDF